MTYLLAGPGCSRKPRADRTSNRYALVIIGMCAGGLSILTALHHADVSEPVGWMSLLLLMLPALMLLSPHSQHVHVTQAWVVMEWAIGIITLMAVMAAIISGGMGIRLMYIDTEYGRLIRSERESQTSAGMQSGADEKPHPNRGQAASPSQIRAGRSYGPGRHCLTCT